MNTASFIASSLHVLSRRKLLVAYNITISIVCVCSAIDTRVEGLETGSCEYLQSTIWALFGVFIALVQYLKNQILMIRKPCLEVLQLNYFI